MGNEVSAEDNDYVQEDGDGDLFTKSCNRLTTILKKMKETMVELDQDIEALECDSDQNEDDSDLQGDDSDVQEGDDSDLQEEEEEDSEIDEEDLQLQAEIDAEVHRFPDRWKAEMYVTLSKRFPEADRLDKEEAINHCNTIEMAATFLNRECQLCTDTFPQTKMTSLFSCQHACCDGCAAEYYNTQIREKHISAAKCPFCDEPKEEEDLADHYVWLAGTLTVLYGKGLVNEELVRLFERKLTQSHLEKDPLFRWCGQCPNGMIVDNECQKWMKCDNCQKKSCIDCQQLWQDQHEKLTCDQFAQWKHDNDPKFQALEVEKQLQAEGIQCPHCKRRYFLARGGCLHFICPHCKFEFCSGCGNQFSRGSNCPQGGAACRNNGLHAHHPKNCFYYLRDRNIDELEDLLKRNNVQYQDIRLGNTGQFCKVLEQKDTVEGLRDEECGKNKYKQTGLCETHYSEQLCLLLNRNRIDV